MSYKEISENLNQRQVKKQFSEFQEEQTWPGVEKLVVWPKTAANIQEAQKWVNGFSAGKQAVAVRYRTYKRVEIIKATFNGKNPLDFKERIQYPWPVRHRDDNGQFNNKKTDLVFVMEVTKGSMDGVSRLVPAKYTDYIVADQVSWPRAHRAMKALRVIVEQFANIPENMKTLQKLTDDLSSQLDPTLTKGLLSDVGYFRTNLFRDIKKYHKAVEQLVALNEKATSALVRLKDVADSYGWLIGVYKNGEEGSDSGDSQTDEGKGLVGSHTSQEG